MRRALLAFLLQACPPFLAAQCDLRKTVASRAQLEEIVSDVRAMSSPALAEALELMAGSSEVEIEWCWPERRGEPSGAPEPSLAGLPRSLADDLDTETSDGPPEALETATKSARRATVGSLVERDGLIQLWLWERPRPDAESSSVCMPLERIPWDPGLDPELVQPPDSIGDRLRGAADPKLLEWADRSVSCMDRGIAEWLAHQGYDPTNASELERFERDRRLEEEVFTDPKGKRVYRVTLLDLKF